MDVLHDLRVSLNVLGIKKKEGNFGCRVYIYLVLQVVIITNIACLAADRWHNVDERFVAIKTIIFILYFVVYSISFICNWDEFASVIDIFSEVAIQIPYKISSRRQHLITSLENDLNKFNNLWKTITVVYIVPNNLIPIIIVIIKFIFIKDDFQKIIKQNLSTPYPLYYPKYLERFGDFEHLLNIIVYVCGYLTHSTFIVMSSIYAHLAHVTTLCAITNVEFDLKLLRLSLVEMDSFVRQKIYSYDNMDRCEATNKALEYYLKYFINHHQKTLRRYNIVNQGIKWIAATLCTNAAFYMCLCIYTIIQTEDIVLKIQEAFFLSLLSYSQYLFDACSERVRTEAENLRIALYECSWLDKPKWFKKSLLVSITYSCSPIGIKPFGLFAFNLNAFSKNIIFLLPAYFVWTFSLQSIFRPFIPVKRVVAKPVNYTSRWHSTMNAAYSYYNILREFKTTVP